MLQELLPLFASLNSHNARYLVIGGVAAISYGVPRLTLDVDLLIEPTGENAVAVLEAFGAAGLGTAALTTPADLLATEITVFQDRVRIDVQTRTPGIEFSAAYARRKELVIERVTVPLLSLSDLIASKKAAGRPRDLEDVRILEQSEER